MLHSRISAVMRPLPVLCSRSLQYATILRLLLAFIYTALAQPSALENETRIVQIRTNVQHFPWYRGPRLDPPTFLNNVGLAINLVLDRYPNAQLMYVRAKSDMAFVRETDLKHITVGMISGNDIVGISSDDSKWGEWRTPGVLEAGVEVHKQKYSVFDWSDLHDFGFDPEGAIQLMINQMIENRRPDLADEDVEMVAEFERATFDCNTLSVQHPQEKSRIFGEQIVYELEGAFNPRVKSRNFGRTVIIGVKDQRVIFDVAL